MNYSITLRVNDSNEGDTLAKAIVENYGESFDTAIGDFTVERRGGRRLEILAKNVAEGDVRVFVEDIGRDFADDLSVIRVLGQSDEASGWFPIDLKKEK